ncbi:MAG: hypothetical protein ACLQU3_33150 [Limisphaerales bacterium]
MNPPRSLHEIQPVLRALAQTSAVIIGGQAVNLWAEHYQKDSSPWNELRPYTSFDLDVLGNRTDVLKCSQSLNATPFFPGPDESTANSGKIITQVGNSDFEIDFLHSPNGLAPAEITELARAITFESITLRVLHPIHCVESKTVNLATLPQHAGERQDLKHLRLSIAILREYLTELTLQRSHDNLLLRWAQRIRTDANHELGLQATMKYSINFQDAIPADLWREHPGTLADFVNGEWQKWADEIAGKTSDLRDLDAWVKSLKDKSAGPASE